jgi:serine/threonine protein kinase/tetratricopeptide (TPR) repeat protein
MPASGSSADRNLLFGILALQMDFVSKDGLIGAMNAWVLNKAKPLGDILSEQGTLRPEHRTLLDALVQAHLALHSDDAAQSLAALSSLGSARQALEQIADPDVRASLGVVAAARDDTDDPYATRAPATVGEPTSAGLRFRILRPHAEGGLGKVSVALDEELNREVALKEIKLDCADDDQSRARFLLEAEVTGGLEHPGVVPVYGLGSYADGRPFYAMRFIKGDSLEKALVRFHTKGRARTRADFGGQEFRGLLRRFVDVCNAMAYAHSRQVLHRDLKPDNIMLGKYGETLVVDWGLAKSVARKGAEAVLATDEPPLQPLAAHDLGQTRRGAVAGTPAYMSPEQATGRWELVGPASDICSLGATLYAVVTGQSPFTGENIVEVIDKAQRSDYPLPRQVNPAVPPALDAICRKAMAPDREDRYPSALDLAADVECWLADQPVSAYPEPFFGRVWRWVRTHERLVTGALAVGVVSLVLGTVTTLLWAANDRAVRMARTATATADFLTSLFQSSDPIALEGFGVRVPQQNVADLTARQMLDQGRERLKGHLLDEPLTRAAMLDTIGNVYRSLGLLEQAGPLLQEGLDLRRRHLGEKHEDVATSLYHLAWLRQDQGQFEEADTLYRRALALREAVFGPEDLRTAAVKFNLAWALALRYDVPDPKRVNEAETLFQEVLRVRRLRLGERHRDVGLSVLALGTLTLSRGDMERGRALLDQAFDILERPDSKDALTSVIKAYSAATVERQARHFKEAAPLHREALDSASRLLGKEHPWCIILLADYAGLLRQNGEDADAEKAIREAIELGRHSPIRWHPAAIGAAVELADALRDQRKFEEAEQLYREALDIVGQLQWQPKVVQIQAKLAELETLRKDK